MFVSLFLTCRSQRPCGLLACCDRGLESHQGMNVFLLCVLCFVK
jgi:hypothetical protein